MTAGHISLDDHQVLNGSDELLFIGCLCSFLVQLLPQLSRAADPQLVDHLLLGGGGQAAPLVRLPFVLEEAQVVPVDTKVYGGLGVVHGPKVDRQHRPGLATFVTQG